MAAYQDQIIIHNGTIYDGLGGEPTVGNILLEGDRISSLGVKAKVSGQNVIDASGMAVAPGFINMLSWANDALIEDGRSQSDIRQGVTLEVMGEGHSYGPLNQRMKHELLQQQGDIQYPIDWTTLDEFLQRLVQGGVACNVASFVGSGTLRNFVVGYEDRPATEEELGQICTLTQQAMKQGALGLASALIYVPDCFNRTTELAVMARVAAEHGGLYISHLRSEGSRFLEALDELISITRQAGIRAEIYHLKASGRLNWDKLQPAIEKVQAAQAEGLQISADMYPYIASATGLDAAMPPWVREGGHEAWIQRLKDPQIRQRLAVEIAAESGEWENGYVEAGGAENILLLSFKNETLKPLTGKTLAEAAALRGTPPIETMFNLVVEDDSRVGASYFSMSEENLLSQIALPWVSFGSDEASQAPEGVFLKSNPHPRAYGTFARLLGKYVRDEGRLTLAEAVRRLTSLPAANLRLDRRGVLKEGYIADLVVFDPLTINDRATFDQPHQYARGVKDVFVNGVQVLRDGEHTGALPGRVVRGPGAKQHG